MQRILVPIDLSKPNTIEPVVNTVKKLGSVEAGEINLLYAMEPLHEYVRNVVPEEMVEEQRVKHVEEMRKIIEDYGLQDSASAEICVGHPAECILKQADSTSADLIVLSSRDPDDTNFLLGSVAGRIARRAHCSVYVVRQA